MTFNQTKTYLEPVLLDPTVFTHAYLFPSLEWVTICEMCVPFVKALKCSSERSEEGFKKLLQELVNLFHIFSKCFFSIGMQQNWVWINILSIHDGTWIHILSTHDGILSDQISLHSIPKVRWHFYNDLSLDITSRPYTCIFVASRLMENATKLSFSVFSNEYFLSLWRQGNLCPI